MGQSSSKRIDEATMQQIIERFNYVRLECSRCAHSSNCPFTLPFQLDENHDGNITLAELKEYHRQFDPNMDIDEVTKEFGRLDIDGNGEIRLSEYLVANGIDVKKSAAELEASRIAELEREARDVARGVTAVEILPGGSEAAEINVHVEARTTVYAADTDVVQATVAGTDADVVQATVASTNAYDDVVPVVAEAVSFAPDTRAH